MANTLYIRNEPATSLHLKEADILLVHTKHSIWGSIIRFGTHSYWNHALIVCNVKKAMQGYDTTLVVDAKTDGAISMDYVNKYLDNLSKYDIAVKRFEAGWFTDNLRSRKADFHSRICSFAVNEVEIKLGSKLLEVVDQLLRQFTLILRFLRRKLGGPIKPPRLPWKIRPIQVKAFTCGGFVQWCYYKGVSQIIKEGCADKSRLNEVVFNPRVKKKVTPFELLTTTAADLAESDKLSWIYIIKDGTLRKTSGTRDEIPLHQLV